MLVSSIYQILISFLDQCVWIIIIYAAFLIQIISRNHIYAFNKIVCRIIKGNKFLILYYFYDITYLLL